jgi:hypothetical protein
MQTERRRIMTAALHLARRLANRPWWHGVTIDYANRCILIHTKRVPSAEDLAVLDNGQWQGFRVRVGTFGTLWPAPPHPARAH